MADLSNMPIAELIQRAQGCREHSCPYHGEFNRELARRRLVGKR